MVARLADSGPVIFRQRLWAGLADGSVTVAFRRWRRPTVKTGGTLQSPGGLLAIDSVDVIGADAITDEDVRAAGYPDRGSVLASLRPEGDLYRIRFHRLGEDPRVSLRQQSSLSAAEFSEVKRALGRLPWAVEVLEVIERHPEVVSTELAAVLGEERLPFKQRVRRLKALGLTESLAVGYRLSPRGEAVLALLHSGPGVSVTPSE